MTTDAPTIRTSELLENSKEYQDRFSEYQDNAFHMEQILRDNYLKYLNDGDSKELAIAKAEADVPAELREKLKDLVTEMTALRSDVDFAVAASFNSAREEREQYQRERVEWGQERSKPELDK